MTQQQKFNKYQRWMERTVKSKTFAKTKANNNDYVNLIDKFSLRKTSELLVEQLELDIKL